MCHTNLFIDMVHDNPGEPPFETKYREPKTLRSLGFTGQVAKDIQTTIPFDSLGVDLFPADSDERKWFNTRKEEYSRQIEIARNAGLDMYYHIDLFVFPEKLVRYFGDEMLLDGMISIRKERTQQLCRVMIQELFIQYPDLQGLVIRVGETYLQDTPYHMGNSAIKYSLNENECFNKQEQFVILINLLREEICEKLNRSLIFRTWDCSPDCFHADPDYYLAITNQIEPHHQLYFSIKHTALDFWRRVRFNPCLTIGKHQQIVEVQCQREYEGKGAYPMYHMGGVINGFSELTEQKGLKDIVGHPLFKGVFTWTRGGGWNGPYIENEFWIDINVEVLSNWLLCSGKGEQEVFIDVLRAKGLTGEDSKRFRKLCDITQEAILKGRYCQGYDMQYKERVMPVENWLRDDHLGGGQQLEPIFDYLHANNLLDDAIAEKEQSWNLWKQAEDIASQICFPDSDLNSFFHVSVTYGRLLYEIIYYGWCIIACKYQKHDCEMSKLEELVATYRQSIFSYHQLFKKNPNCPTLHQFARRVNEYDDEVKTMSANNFMIEDGEGMDHWICRYCETLGINTGSRLSTSLGR